MATRLLLIWEDPAVARRLRDAGYEVVLLAAGLAAEAVAAVAVQEDVVAVAVADADLGALVAERIGPEVVVFSVT
jgi:methylmalonyl-CoA mutase cobalamin-binding subunit